MLVFATKKCLFHDWCQYQCLICWADIGSSGTIIHVMKISERAMFPCLKLRLHLRSEHFLVAWTQPDFSTLEMSCLDLKTSILELLQYFLFGNFERIQLVLLLVENVLLNPLWQYTAMSFRNTYATSPNRFLCLLCRKVSVTCKVFFCFGWLVRWGFFLLSFFFFLGFLFLILFLTFQQLVRTHACRKSCQSKWQDSQMSQVWPKLSTARIHRLPINCSCLPA